MAIVFTSDASHANRNLAFLTTKNKIFFVFFTSQFDFMDDIFTTLKLMISFKIYDDTKGKPEAVNQKITDNGLKKIRTKG
jgi:hypothetical protein